ncbi:helix-turn-helix domain-containing protein [Mastigocoleus testarum]|uniref:HTH araC/xylS-type domain-containing protein n=1 Tax=Mastigocoleus testarum BC008 TaxID=371196 RepID=A0A0V7ZQ30_9CYAN|nr:AraC family transcriptional regulator [Mastigocoleus testarum]KST66191.1 hypothetical protein BC008_24800 [Mastigocoleus testarum BC008]
MSESRPQSIDFNPNFILSEDLLQTSRLQMRVFTENPIDGVTWHAGYSDPYLVINFRAQLQTFEMEVDGKNSARYLVVPGNFSFVQPGFKMSGFYKGTQMCYASITFPSERLNPRFADGKPKIGLSDPVIRTLAEALYIQRHRNDPDAILYRESITETLIQHLQLIHFQSDSLGDIKPPSLDYLESYVRERLDCKLTVSQLATIVGTSPQTLQRLVNKQFGQSVYEWVTTLRLERSLDLLSHSQMDLAAIAMESGFANQSHWTRLFRRKFGITPGKLRS